MASQGYRDWLKAGRPYTLVRPAEAVQATLRGYGLTVFDYPNDAHLQANTPEDHTPFSVTGFPGTNLRWNARALDVMPRNDSTAARKENADIARQLIRDRDAGVAGTMWIKYLNWTDEKGVCQQERWTDPNNPLKRTTRSSSDKGHIHISGRSDADEDDRADGYDPIARMNGEVFSVADSQLVANAERGVTALVAGTPVIQFDYPWPGVPKAGYPNPLVQMAAKLDALVAAAAADKARDDAVIAVLKAAGGDAGAAAMIAAVQGVRDQVHADIVGLQQQLAESQAREVALAQELAEVRAAVEVQMSAAELAKRASPPERGPSGGV